MKCIDLKTKYSRNKLAKLNSQTASREYTNDSLSFRVKVLKMIKEKKNNKLLQGFIRKAGKLLKTDFFF